MEKIIEVILNNMETLKEKIGECRDLTTQTEIVDFLREKRENGETNCEYLAREGFFDKISKDEKTPLVFDGKIQPVFDYEECIFEKVFVETDLDTDGDGKRDLVAVYIRRPKETLEGMKVPAIYVANPYMMKCVEEVYEKRMYNVDRDLDPTIKEEEKREETVQKELPPKRISVGEATVSPTEEIELDCISEWYKYFNSRGVASVFSAGVGTEGSEGINCTGSKDEKKWVISVIEWLNGKRKAFTDKENNIEIKAEWCTGRVAMSGKSYLGTMCIAAATTGVEGLKTVIPEAAISSWYNYYRMNGVTASPLGWQGDDADLLTDYCRCRKLTDDKQIKIADKISGSMRRCSDRESGNYNDYWRERDYLLDVDKIKASVFIVHGLNDWNVKTNQCYNLWNELKKYDVPSKMILHQGEHIYIDRLKGIDFNEIMNMWISHWLYEVDNGVMTKVPDVLVQSNLDQDEWLKFDKNSKGIEKIYRIDKNGKLSLNSKEISEKSFQLRDDITALGFDRESKKSEEWQKHLVLDVDKERKERAIYLGEVLDENMIISGGIKVGLDFVSKQNKGLLSVMLVDYGKQKRLNPEQKFVEEECITLGRKTGEVSRFFFAKDDEYSEYKIISRGHMNLQNIRGREKKIAIVPGETYSCEIDMIPTNHIVPKGNRIGLIVYGTDVEITQRPLEVMEYEIKESSIELKFEEK
ncbi:Xaa-Pro dipeptidyl-peptidase [Fusobacterium sp.]|uniref:Xaa-Pro dipeptidyl-peptidase n=1 Tax=Fusobacterium sp. TaxID=68766 RepID=UPI002612A559|nr:Xaa-Pro dipeptidyl-peptidase [Fusobacterium sp.]